MPAGQALLDAVHDATHRMPGVPEHHDYPRGHQGATHHGASLQKRTPARIVGAHQGTVAAHDRPPLVLVDWQNWIASLFTRKTR